VSGRIVIVGGGIAGMTTAFRLLAVPGLDVTLLEADPTPGGKIRSIDVGGLELDAGPDSLIARKPWAVELCRELGLEAELVAPSAGAPYVWTGAGLIRFPAGPFGIPTDLRELWSWPGISRRGRLRALADLVRRPPRLAVDESLGALLRRRLGDEATEAIVGPLLGGLFAGDVDHLSVLATFPELAAWEQRHGSLIRGARSAGSPSRDAPPMFLRPRGGVRRLIEELERHLGNRLRTGVSAGAIERDGLAYVVRADGTLLPADAMVLATPAFVASDLLRGLAPSASATLAAIQNVSTAVVLLVYGRGTGPALPDSSGFVAPRGELAMTACTVVSRKWPDERVGDRAVLRCFVGGVGAEDLLDQPDDEIVTGVARQLAALLPLPARPESASVVRWPRAMPQYEVGHMDRVAAIERSLPPGIFVTGQAYRGVGIADCVRAANETADRVAALLAERIDVTEAGSIEQEPAR
jgi:protoporphyrinogen/coproporphyrinogen III oxidase